MVSVPSDLSTRAALSFGALSALALAYKLLVAKPALPPGTHAPRRAPSSHWLLGDLPAVLRNGGRFNEYVLETTRACGEQPWLQRAPLMPDMVIVATPTMFEEITRTQFESFGKGDFTRESVYEIFGDSFFSLDGPAWFHQRKTAVKFFTGRMYREVAMPVTHAHVMRLLNQLSEAQKSGKEIDFTGVLNAFALQNFAELGFGLNIDEVDPMPLHLALEEAFVGVLHRMQKPTWLWQLQKRLNVGEERKFRETTSFIRSFVLALVRDSLDKSAQKALDDDRPARTMVELFIDAMRHGEGEFTPELLCDIAIMFMIAGRDTTVAVLEWFFHTLSKHPDVEQRIRDELWENVPELMDGSVETISIEQAAKLVYLEAAIKETMRLYPAATLAPREALRDTVLCDGTFIPKGMKIGLAPYTMARLESVWGPDAAQYKPTRFLDPATGKVAIVPQSKFYGFGAGARNCIGMNLALLEMKMMVSSLLSRFQLELAPNDGKCKFSAGIVIDTPLKATVHAAPSRIAKAA